MIEDFIPIYPSPTDPHIQKIISSKMEFADLEPSVIDPVPKPGDLYNHQKMFVRLMRLNDRMLNIQETGTGKSCAFIAACEFFKKTGLYRTAYIFEKGSTTSAEMKNQIVKKCTKNVYDLDTYENQSVKSYKIQVNRNVNKWYSIRTYRAFASHLETLDDKKIIDMYSKCIFIFDEVHNLVNIGKDNFTTQSDMINVYKQFKRLFVLAKQTKIALITATPMIKEATDLAVILNLLLPEDRQLPPNYKHYNLLNLNMWEPYLRGLVTYIRSSEFGARPVYNGNIFNYVHKALLPDDTSKVKFDLTKVDSNRMPPYKTVEIPSSTRIYEVEMGDLQFDIYKNTFVRVQTFQHENAFQTKLIDKAMFVFPNDTDYSSYLDGENYQFLSNPNFRNWKHKGEHKNFGSWLYNNGDLSNIYRVSAKLARLLDIELKSQGCSFIYTGRVEGIGGNVIMALFKLFGYELYSKNSDMHTKKKRIAFLTSSTENEHEEILKIFNSDANIDGEYIKIIIGSPVARDGINLFHCLRCHILTPQWTPSGMIQAVNRVLRAVSHQAIVKRRMLGKNLSILSEANKKDLATVNVDIYKYAAVYPSGEKLYKDGKEEYPVDNIIYLSAEQKDIEIKTIMRYLKQCSVDCWINRNRNIRLLEENNTPDCDFQDCKYECFEVKRYLGFVDNSTYNILYYDEITDLISEEIIKLISVYGYLTVPQIISMFKEYDKYFIYFALNKIIESKTKITNSFGFQSFVTSDGYSVYIQFDYPTIKNFETSNKVIEDLYVYESMLIGIEYNSFIELFLNSQDTDVDKLDNQIRMLFTALYTDINDYYMHAEDPDYVAVPKHTYAYLDSLYPIQLIQNVERFTHGAAKKYLTAFIKSKYPAYYYEFDGEFMQEIFQTDAFKKYIGDKLYYDITTDNDYKENIEVHMFVSRLVANTTSYSTVSSYENKESKMRIRVNKNYATYWKTANEVEQKIFSYLIRIQDKRLEITDESTGVSLYGTVLTDNIFRIIDKRTEAETDDKRKKHRGRSCLSKKFEELFEIISLEGYEVETVNKLSNKELDQFMKKMKFDISQIEKFKIDKQYIYDLYTKLTQDGHTSKNDKKIELCNIIQDLFEKSNKMYINQ